MELYELMTTDMANEEGSQALIAQVSGETFAIPLSSILSIEKVAVSEINSVDQDAVIYHRGKVIPLVYLDKLFRIDSENTDKDNIIVVVCMHDEKYFGIVVDDLEGQKEITSKSLGILNDNAFFTGASILEDKLALVLNLGSFVA